MHGYPASSQPILGHTHKGVRTKHISATLTVTTVTPIIATTLVYISTITFQWLGYNIFSTVDRIFFWFPIFIVFVKISCYFLLLQCPLFVWPRRWKNWNYFRNVVPISIIFRCFSPLFLVFYFCQGNFTFQVWAFIEYKREPQKSTNQDRWVVIAP